MAFPSRVRQRSGASAGETLTASSHDLLWLALRWEAYIQGKLNARMSVVDHRLQQIKSKYVKTFQKLDVHLRTSNTSANEYYSLLCTRFREHQTAIRPYTRNLGGKFYNTIVEEQRVKRSARFGGRPDQPRQTYLDLPTRSAGYTPPRLALDTVRLAKYRRQYHWFEWGRFWVLFAHEFSGTFLYFTSSYRDLPRTLQQLSTEQQREWVSLDGDQKLVDRTREHYRVFRHRVGVIAWHQTHGQSLESLAEQIQNSPPSPRHSTG